MFKHKVGKMTCLDRSRTVLTYFSLNVESKGQLEVSSFQAHRARTSQPQTFLNGQLQLRVSMPSPHHNQTAVGSKHEEVHRQHKQAAVLKIVTTWDRRKSTKDWPRIRDQGLIKEGKASKRDVATQANLLSRVTIKRKFLTVSLCMSSKAKGSQ